VDEQAAVELVARARTEPGSGYQQLRKALDGEHSDDVLSVLLRGLGEVTRWVTTVDESAEYLERAIAHARSAGRDELLGQALLTMSSTRLLAGDSAAAMDALEEAGLTATGRLQAQVEFQRGLVLGREGRADEALAACDRALPIFEEFGDTYFAACTRGNRALIRLERGEARTTRADLIAARDGFRAVGHAASVAWMTHNLGRVAGRLGDVPGALRYFRESERALRRLNVDTSEVQVNRAEVLLQAGLYGEAEEVATAAACSMAERGLELDRAEAVFARSQALLGQLKYGEAARVAAEAAGLLASQGRAPWALRAELVAMHGDPGIDDTIVERCLRLAGQLISLGQVLAAAQAYALVARHDANAAQAGLDRLSLRPAEVPLEHRLTALDVLARSRMALGDRRGALRATRLAIDLANRHRLLRGAADLRAAVSAQMDSIARLGLALRRDTNRATAVLHWVDRCHDGTTRATEALLDDVPERSDLLAKLRASQQRLRTAHVDDAPTLLREQARLQRQLVAADRRVGGTARHHDALPRDVARRLRNVVVLQYHRHGSLLSAVVVIDGRACIVDLGELDQIERSVELLRRAIRRLAQSHASGVDDERSLAAVRRHASTLETLVVPHIDQAPSSVDSLPHPLVIVPLTHHIGVPWSVLPKLSSRPLTVAPSLRHWVMHASTQHMSISKVALVEGVELSGTTEIGALAEAWASVNPVVIRGATVENAIRAMGRADLLHLACHGGRRARDGRFAQLKLADGDLVSFELERLTRTPRVVTMAACEAGLLEPLPGDESAGLATALFAATTATVVAPVVVVPDNSLTREVFIEFHRSMTTGVAPAAALFAAQSSRADEAQTILARSINCFGWG
jgi:tetratricopeptide (TPR) repeat protein